MAILSERVLKMVNDPNEKTLTLMRFDPKSQVTKKETIKLTLEVRKVLLVLNDMIVDAYPMLK